MRSAVRAVAILAVIAAGPSPARAQGYLAPALGVTFGNPSSEGRANFVADLGWLSRVDPLGVELDFMYAPSFFGNQGPFGQNRVVTVMGNVIFAGGAGRRRFGFGRRQNGVRPYVSGGVGLIHEVATDPGGHEFGNNDLGLNLGVGVMATSRRSIGVRADLRYFHDVVNNQSGNTTGIDFGSFHFWRAGIGVVLGL